MVNVGGEGQIVVGAVAAAGVGLAIDQDANGALVIVLMLLASATFALAANQALAADLPRKARETAILQEYPAVFIYGIGWVLKDGYPHEMRAADYDDWVTETNPDNGSRFHGLNGDILVWNPVTRRRHELSSMGIRVNAFTLRRQLELTDQLDFLKLPYHQAVLNDEVVAIGQDQQPAGGRVVKAKLARPLDVELAASALVVGAGLYEIALQIRHLIEIGIHSLHDLELLLVELLAAAERLLVDRLGPGARSDRVGGQPFLGVLRHHRGRSHPKRRE